MAWPPTSHDGADALHGWTLDRECLQGKQVTGSISSPERFCREARPIDPTTPRSDPVADSASTARRTTTALSSTRQYRPTLKKRPPTSRPAWLVYRAARNQQPAQNVPSEARPQSWRDTVRATSAVVGTFPKDTPQDEIETEMEENILPFLQEMGFECTSISVPHLYGSIGYAHLVSTPEKLRAIVARRGGLRVDGRRFWLAQHRTDEQRANAATTKNVMDQNPSKPSRVYGSFLRRYKSGLRVQGHRVKRQPDKNGGENRKRRDREVHRRGVVRSAPITPGRERDYVGGHSFMTPDSRSSPLFFAVSCARFLGSFVERG